VPSQGGIIDDSGKTATGVKVTMPANLLGKESTKSASVVVTETRSVPKTYTREPLAGKGKEISATLGENVITNFENGRMEIELVYYKDDIEEMIEGFIDANPRMIDTDVLYNKINGLDLSYFDSTANNWASVPSTMEIQVDAAGGQEVFAVMNKDAFIADMVAGNSDNYDDYKIILKGSTDHMTIFAPTYPTDVVAPAKPTGLIFTAGNGQVTLDWADNAEADLLEYEVYRSTATPVTIDNAHQINITSVTTSAFTDSAATNGVKYYYAVTAVDTSGNESTASTEASATPTAPAAAPVPVSRFYFAPITTPEVITPKVEVPKVEVPKIPIITPIVEKIKEIIEIPGLKVKVPEKVVEVGKSLLSGELPQKFVAKVNKKISTGILGKVYQLVVREAKTLENRIDAVLAKAIDVTLAYDKNVVRDQKIDLRRLVITRWDAGVKEWIAEPAKLNTKDATLTATTKRAGNFAMQVMKNVNKWSPDGAVQVDIPKDTTKPGEALVAGVLQKEFEARPTGLYKEVVGNSYQLVTIGTKGFAAAKNRGALEKETEITVRYDKDLVTSQGISEKRLHLVKYDPVSRLWKKVKNAECQYFLGQFKAKVKDLGVYAVMAIK